MATFMSRMVHVSLIMVPAHFDDVDSDLYDHNVGKTFWIVQNSENDLVTSIFIRILIGIIMVHAHFHDGIDKTIW